MARIRQTSNWVESWEIARPWIKDPRVHQPQRLFHPEGWAAGELDLVLRWDGKIRIIDIKSGNPSSKFAESLQHQLKTSMHGYGMKPKQIIWLMVLRDGTLDDSSRIQYDVPSDEEMDELRNLYRTTHREMLELGEGPVRFPEDYPEPCNNSAGCFWCQFGQDSENEFLIIYQIWKSVYLRPAKGLEKFSLE